MSAILVSGNNNLELCISPEEWVAKQVRKDSKVKIRCSECKLVVESRVGNVARTNAIACICSGRFKYDSNVGREYIENVVEESRFIMIDDIHLADLSKGCYARISLKCERCDVVVTPQVGALTMRSSCGIGCLCSSPDEKTVFDAVSEFVADSNTGYVTTRQYDFRGELRGRLGKKFRSDIAIAQNDNLPVLVIEVDGGYHFSCSAPKGRRLEENRCQENDVIKEQWCVDQGIPMVRISCRIIHTKPKSTWLPLLKVAYEDAVTGTFRGIRRIADNNCYRSGVYANRRVGTSLEVVDVAI